jgi:hypothetical protein
MCIYVYIHISTFGETKAFVYICIHMCTYVHIYVYVYIHIQYMNTCIKSYVLIYIYFSTGYMDKAAGIHVRFRLGGSIFPPSIYFKIYTHRPVCDVNAFAPRMYSKEEKPNLSKHTNSENQTFLPYKNPKKNLQTEKIISKKMRVGNKFYGAVVTTTVGMFLLCIYI